LVYHVLLMWNPWELSKCWVTYWLGNYHLSLSSNLRERVDNIFFFSHDGCFLVKTLSDTERDHLIFILADYYKYISDNPNTLLPRFYGVYSISYLQFKFSFMVTENVFKTALKVHEVYDLKGSTLGRLTGEEKGVKKDLDLKESIFVGHDLKTLILQQVQNDASFLRDHDIIDYSFLLGIHSKDKAVAGDQVTDKSVASSTYFSSFQSEEGGLYERKEDGSFGSKVYFVGIIDSLIRYGVRKTAEHNLKSMVYASNTMSVVPPDIYHNRFTNFLGGIFE